MFFQSYETNILLQKVIVTYNVVYVTLQFTHITIINTLRYTKRIKDNGRYFQRNIYNHRNGKYSQRDKFYHFRNKNPVRIKIHEKRLPQPYSLQQPLSL